jgi:hypothetical protein
MSAFFRQSVYALTHFSVTNEGDFHSCSSW